MIMLLWPLKVGNKKQFNTGVSKKLCDLSRVQSSRWALEMFHVSYMGIAIAI
jgi:hypothetical protein